MSSGPPSSYTPFVQRVFVPAVRSTLMVLAVLAIGFGSWLETTTSIQNRAFRRHMAMTEVSLFRNISDDSIMPDSVTFGLWRHCFIYSLDSACSSVQLTYDIDAPLVLQAAITNNTAVPETHASSYARVVPLMMATILGSIAVLYGFYCNRFTHKHALQWINAGLVLACTILIAVSFGYTYHQYTTRIQAVCNHTDLIQCTDTRLGVEFILLVIGVCLSALAFLFWAAPSCFHFISSSAPTTQTKKQRLSSSAQEKRRKSSTMLPGAPADPLAAWREASLISEAESASMMEQKEFYQYDTTALPPPPPNSHHHYYYQDEQLVPPSRPYVPQRASPSSSRGRRTSQASGNTFGADYRLRYSRSSSITLEDDPRSEDGRLTTPTSLTPRPTAQDEYFCITPIDNTSSSIRSQSPSLDPRRRSSSQQSSPMPSHVPELSHPPPTRHPLNRKVITDERISAYLQQRRQQGSQSS